MTPRIAVQAQDFDPAQEYAALQGPGVGAVVLFVGIARDYSTHGDVEALELEHYPGMTEQELGRIGLAAAERWSLQRLSVVHRVGRIAAGEQIVLVGAGSAHRRDAFAACEFIMDYLKTSAPLWKKEIGARGEYWVEARGSDRAARQRWEERRE